MPVVISSPMGLSFPLRNDSTPILMGAFLAAKTGEPKTAMSAKTATVNIAAERETSNHLFRVYVDLVAITLSSLASDSVDSECGHKDLPVSAQTEKKD